MKKKIAATYLSVLLALLVYYTWTSTHEGYVLFYDDDAGSYADLADAFLHGQVALLIKPDPRLDTINPYNPNERGEIGAPWDYSFFRGKHEAHGKFYLYFGPVPALLFYCPWKLVTGLWPSEHLIFLILSFVDAVLFACILRLLVQRYLTNVPVFLEGVILAMYGLCNLATYLLCTPRMYQLAIGSGVVFTLAFFLFSLLALPLGSRRHLWLTLASLSAGLAFGSRGNDIFLYGGLIFLWIYIHRQKYWARSVFNLSFLSETTALFLPALLCALGMAWYNYARFGNPFDFGMNYQITSEDMLFYPFFSWYYIPEGVWAYFIMPWMPIDHFPYINPDSQIIPHSICAGRTGREVTSGIFTSYPITLLSFAWPFYVRQIQDSAHRVVIIAFGVLVTVWGLVLDFLLVSWSFVTFRYMMELIMPSLILAALTLLLRRQMGPFARWQVVVLTLLLVYSCYVGVVYGLIGNNDWINE